MQVYQTLRWCCSCCCRCCCGKREAPPAAAPLIQPDKVKVGLGSILHAVFTTCV